MELELKRNNYADRNHGIIGAGIPFGGQSMILLLYFDFSFLLGA